jgi:hypothetical protein
MLIVHLKFIPWLGSSLNNLTKWSCFMRNPKLCGRSKMLARWDVSLVKFSSSLRTRSWRRRHRVPPKRLYLFTSRRLATPQPEFSLAPLWAPQISQCALLFVIILRLVSIECCDVLKPLEWCHVLNLLLSCAEKSILACSRKRKTSLNVKSVPEVYLCMCLI